MCEFVIDWILAYIIVKIHHFQRVGKNSIFSSKTMIILVWVIRCKYCILKRLWAMPFCCTSFQLWVPLDTQDELCWYSYLKIYTARKCSATVMLAFFFFLKQDFHLKIPFPFLWQMAINSLAISKYISTVGEDNFFLFAKTYTDVHQWKNYTVYCLDDIILR